MTLLSALRRIHRAAPLHVTAFCLAAGCATVTDDGDGMLDDETAGDGDLGSGGSGDGAGGVIITSGSGGGTLIGNSGGASSGGSSSGGSSSGGSSSGGSSSGGANTGGSSSGGSGTGGSSSGGAGTGGAGTGGGPSGEMCDAAPWASGPQGTYVPGDHVTAICDDAELNNGHECYGFSGKYWFYCEGDSYQCSTFDPAGTVAHGVWQISASPCP